MGIQKKEQQNKKPIMKKEKGNFAKIFELLGSGVRLKILRIIANEGKSVNLLSKYLRLSQPTVSYHLGLLFDSGLVQQSRTAQWVRYKLNKDRLAELMGEFSKLYGILGFKKKDKIPMK